VVSTAFTPLASGGAGINPLASFTYRPIGIILDITPRVSYEGGILLELTVESSTRGADVSVAGTTVPSFGTRRVGTKLRLRDGESNLLAGLLREEERKSLSGIPGLIHIPGLRALFGANESAIQQTDIVMLLTPRIIRTHELTQQDLSPIFIGSQGNLGLTGPAPLIAAPAEPEPGAPAPQPAGGAPAPPATVPAEPKPVAPPGTSPVPGTVVPAPPDQPRPAAPSPPEAGQPVPSPGPAAPSTAKPPIGVAGAQIVISTPGPELRVAGGPYTVPISVAGASRLSTVSLTMTFNPQALRVRVVQEGSFMRQGGVNATFLPQIDGAIGRIDITVTRPGDSVGASGTGLLGVVLFDATAPGSSTFTLSGVAATPEGAPVPLTFTPTSVVVR